ncbi:MAG: RNA polymerase sigma factor [Bacteroidales bacterium]
MKETKSDIELIKLIQNNDKVAFYHIYEKYSKRLYWFVFKLIKQKEDAEGLVQDVFVKIWESRHSIDEHSSFKSFLFTIAYNSTISLLRKKASEIKHLEELKSFQNIDKSPSIIDDIHFKELNSKVQSLLAKLTPRQAEIFRLSREDGLSHDEIAKKLDISVNTVKKHISNTLLFLKSEINNNLIINLLFISLFL